MPQAGQRLTLPFHLIAAPSRGRNRAPLTAPRSGDLLLSKDKAIVLLQVKTIIESPCARPKKAGL